MKCPSCGADMKDGMLYCEHCGMDIHIVPDFIPEVENNIEDTINSIVEDIVDSNDFEVENPSVLDKRNKKSKLKGIALFLLIPVFLLLMVGSFVTYTNNSYDVLLKNAQNAANAGRLDEAIDFYLRTLELADNSNIVFIRGSLAEVYLKSGDIEKYESELLAITELPYVKYEDLYYAYSRLIMSYEDRGDYEGMDILLQGCDNTDILNQYIDYTALEPEFSIQSGYYSQIQPLKLSKAGSGKIYYTMDGTDPDENSILYTTPIILDNGDYNIKAYYVNNYGIASKVAIGEFHVSIDVLDIPEVVTVSGVYNFPLTITLEGDTENIYYTIDGSDPDTASKHYVYPLDMPLGKNVFKFIRTDGVRKSEIVERTYTLNLNTDYTYQMACDDLMIYLLNKGKLLDGKGHFNDTDSIYVYEYLTVKNIDGIDDFYCFAEVRRDVDSFQERTGTYYGVNIYTGTIVRLELNNENNYSIVEIEEQH